MNQTNAKRPAARALALKQRGNRLIEASIRWRQHGIAGYAVGAVCMWYKQSVGTTLCLVAVTISVAGLVQRQRGQRAWERAKLLELPDDPYRSD